jgi:hypothetical protein
LKDERDCDFFRNDGSKFAFRHRAGIARVAAFRDRVGHFDDNFALGFYTDRGGKGRKAGKGQELI